MTIGTRIKSGLRRTLVKSLGLSSVVEFIRRGGFGLQRTDSPDSPFAQVEAVNRCVTMYVNAVYQMPLMMGTDRDQLIESGPLADLTDRANPGQSLADVIGDFVGWLLLTGRAHWVFTEMTGDLPTQIIAVGKPMMRPVYAGGQFARSGTLIGWLLKKPGQSWDQATPVALDQVWTVTLRNFDAENPLEGLSIPQVAERKINQVYKADTANERSLDNDMRLSSIVSPEEPVDEQQWREFVAQLRDQNEGFRNRNRTLFTSRKVNVSPQSASFKDMEFPALLDRSVAAICVAFGFDPSAVGYPPPGGRFEYVKAAKASAWLDAIIPFYGWISDEFDRGVLGRFERDRSYTWTRNRDAMVLRELGTSERTGRGYTTKRRRLRRAVPAGSGRLFAWFDDSGVPAVREAKLSLAKEGAILIEKFKSPPADVNDLFDLGLPEHPWQKRGWQTFSEMMIGDDTPEQEQEPAPDVPEDEPADVDQVEAALDSSAKQAQRVMTAAQLRQLWLAWRRSWAGIERKQRKIVTQHFFRLEREMLRNLRQALPGKSVPTGDNTLSVRMYCTPLVRTKGGTLVEGELITRGFELTLVQRDLIGEILFSLTTANGKLVAELGPLITESIRLGGQQSMDEASAAQGEAEPQRFGMQDPEVAAAVQRRTQSIRGINRRAAQRMRVKLAEGLSEGLTREQLEQLVKDTLGIERSRAKLIAFQETSSSVEEARQLGRDQANVPSKSWLWSQKSEGRAWHEQTEAQTMASPVDNDGNFQIVQTGNTCPHPRATGKAIDDISCGCTSISRYPGDKLAELRLFKHLSEKGFTTPEQLAKRYAPQPQDTPEPVEA